MVHIIIQEEQAAGYYVAQMDWAPNWKYRAVVCAQ